MRDACINLAQCEKGSSAAEMALVTPLLMTLIFSSFELGNYFLDNHVVAKAVRDGARYAARQSLSNYPCTTATTGSTPATTVVSNTQNIVRTGQVSGGSARLPGWTNAATVVVTYDCVSVTTGSPSYSGVYNGLSYVPVVKVSINNNSPKLSYHSLFSTLGLGSSTLTLQGRAQAVVVGI